MHDHPHHESDRLTPDERRLLRSGITIRATADRVVDGTQDYDPVGLQDLPPLIDFMDITVQVTTAHSARVNLNAATLAADTALRAVTAEPAEPQSDVQ